MSKLPVTSWNFFKFSNPGIFLRFIDRFLPWLCFFALFFLSLGLYLSFTAPPDYQQELSVRIMFIHVPFAWISMFCYSMMAFSGLGTLIWRHPLADLSLKTAAPIGATFTFIALLTGCIWAKPMWGTWWVWDARLTSVFLLFLMYLGIIVLTRSFDDPLKSARPAAVIALVGFIDIPVIKFSVDWWNTLHQPASLFRLDGVRIHSSFLIPLMVMGLGFFLLFFSFYLFSMRTQILRRRIYRMRFLAAMSEEFP